MLKVSRAVAPVLPHLVDHLCFFPPASPLLLLDHLLHQCLHQTDWVLVYFDLSVKKKNGKKESTNASLVHVNTQQGCVNLSE